MRLILHGELRRRYGTHFDFQARSVGEAVEGLSRQLPDWPRELLIEIPGFSSEEALQETTDVREVHLVPAMFGGGAVGRILVGIVLIVASFVIPGLSAAVAAALIATGISMTLGGIMALFMKAPSTSKSEDPPPSKYFGVNDNTAESGTPITLAYGRINLFGHWLSLQSDADKLVQGTFPASPT